MNKNNILILSAYTDNILWQNYGRNDYYEISLCQNKKYAKKNNYDFKYLEYKIKDIDKNYNPTWIKIKAIMENIKNYNYVCWIDSDAVFLKNIKIESFFGKDIILTKAHYVDGFNHTLTTTSTGFIIIKNTSFSITLFNHLLEQSNKWLNGLYRKEEWHEQGLIDEMYVRPQIISTYKFDKNYYNLVNREINDLDSYFDTENFRILPNKFQSINQENINFIYHASGDTPTKGIRMKESIQNQNEIIIDSNFNNTIDSFIELSKKNNYISDRYKNKRIFISFDSKSLGDTIAWMPYAEEFRKQHNCKVILSTFWNNLFENQYPEIEFVNPGEVIYNIYTSYNIGWYLPWDQNRNPNNFKTIPLQQTASDILELYFKETKPKINIKRKKRGIEQKYACIGVHSTCQAKYWNYPYGWKWITSYLNHKGYRVINISKEGKEYMGNIAPPEAIHIKEESIDDTINLLYNADMFIGISSGLSWLSWAIGTPTILISGFSNPLCEPQRGIERVFNPNVCNSCFNDPNIEFDKGDWNWCPRKKDFECSKKITPDMIIKSINNIRRKNEN